MDFFFLHNFYTLKLCKLCSSSEITSDFINVRGKKNKKINKKSKGSNFSGVRRICPDSSNIEPNWHVLTKLNV